MPVVATINFQIMGEGVVALSGVGEIAGPYWNTVQITDPSLNYVGFDVSIPQPDNWKFVMWGGGVTADSPTHGILPIATNVSATYLAVAVFAEGPRGPPTPACPCPSVVTAAPPEPTHESIRIANRIRACTVQQLPPQPFTGCRSILPPQRVWVRQTPAQNTPPAEGDAVYEAVSAADASDNVYTGLRWWTVDSSKITNSLTVYSHTVAGDFRWRQDLLLGDSSFNIPRSVRSYVACIHDSLTGHLFVAAHMIDTSVGELYFYLFSLDATTGAVLATRVYTETGVGALDLPPLRLATNRAGTLFLASTNAATIFVQSLRMDGTFDQIEYWAGLTNTLSAPLNARCFGLEYDSGGYLYLSLVSSQTIAGGTRVPVFSTDPNTILVKLTASSIGLVWGYQDPALNVDGFSNTNAIVALPDHSLRVLYSTADITNVGSVRFASLSSAGVFLGQHIIPEYAGQFMEMLDMCRTPQGDRLFFLAGPYYLFGLSQLLSFGELSLDGIVTWIEQNATYNPPASFPLISTGLAATNGYLWVAYDTLVPILDQVQTTDDDSVVIQFKIRECINPPEPNCLCSPIPPAQDFRTMHHQNEKQRVLREAVRCPLHFHNRDTGGLCATQHTAVHSAVPSPYRRTTSRPLSRIRGIEEICRPVRNVSASELTARIRSRTESSNATLRRHSEHYRVLPPPPPCRLYRSGPQPGVPIAPVTPCNIGNQRVDYSPPTK